MLFFRLRLHVATVLLLLPLLALLATPVAAQDGTGTLTLEEYRQLVAETRRLAQAVEGGDDEARQALGTVAARWQALEQVSLPDGSHVAVQHDQIIAKLIAGEPDFVGLQQRLESLEAVTRHWPDNAPANGEAALAELDEILRSQQFQWPEEEPGLQEIIWDYVLRLLRRLLPQSLEGSPLLGRLVTGVAVLFLLGVLLYVARTFLHSVSPATSAVSVAPGDRTLTSGSALQQAQDLSHRGNYRAAVRYLYLSTLLLLDERDVLRYDRTRTNGEYLDSVAQQPEVATTLKNVIDVFDRVWYGYQTLDSEDYAWYEAQVRELQNQQ